MSRLYSTVAFAALALVAAPATAQVESIIPDFDLDNNKAAIEREATPFIAAVRQGDLFNANGLVATNQFTGVGGLQIFQGASGSRCSGALISPTLVLTAAHCFGSTGTATTLQFFTPDYVNASRQILVGNAFALHPDYDPVAGVTGGNDVAIIRLANAVTGLQIYDIERTGGEFGVVHTKVGLGALGTGASGQFNSPNSDGRKHYGVNLYEATWDQLVGSSDGVVDDLGGAPVGSILLYDFDSGTAQEDAFFRLGGARQGGVVINGQNRDVSAAPGDSGGPTFINGRIAGITSFGITGDAFLSGFCNRIDSMDQSNNLVTGNCTNSSFGELAGDTRVAAFSGWIDSYLSGAGVFRAVPEPATWAMMIAGFGLVGSAMRRRRPVALTA